MRETQTKGFVKLIPTNPIHMEVSKIGKWEGKLRIS